jgi:hypothetical protein
MKFHQLIWILVFFFHFVFYSEAQDDFVVVEGHQELSEISEIDCKRFMRRGIKRMDKLTARLKKVNEHYLARFAKLEDKLLHQLCDLNESNAETLMQDAWLSFNRFENLCAKEAYGNPTRAIGALDNLDDMVHYFEQKKLTVEAISADSGIGKVKCNCTGIEELSESRKKLKYELKRSELIGKYTRDRTDFMNRVLKDSSCELDPLSEINKSLYYYKSELEENVNLFSDCTGLESDVITQYKQITNYNNDVSNLTGLNPANQSGAPGKISMQELLLKAPIETIAMVANVNNAELQKLKDFRDFLMVSKANIDQLKNDTTQINDAVGSDLEQSHKNRIEHNKSDKKLDNKSWKPNPLKTKRIIDRFNYGGNFQPNRRNVLFPLGGTLAGQLSFQATQSIDIGLGAACILGFMNDRQIGNGFGEMPILKSFGTAGIGLRSFFEVRMAKSFFLMGSGELNYMRSGNTNVVGTPAGRIGLTNQNAGLFFGLKIKYPTKSLSAPSLEILYDLLHERTDQPAIVIRAGINFKRKHSYKL